MRSSGRLRLTAISDAWHLSRMDMANMRAGTSTSPSDWWPKEQMRCWTMWSASCAERWDCALAREGVLGLDFIPL
jgi:hypothetical protein